MLLILLMYFNLFLPIFVLFIYHKFMVRPPSLLPLKKKIYVFYFYFWLCWIFVAVHGLSLVMASWGYSSLGARAAHRGSFSHCRAQALGVGASVATAHRLSCGGALRHVGSSWIRDQTHVSCIGRQVSIHCGTRGSPSLAFFLKKKND